MNRKLIKRIYNVVIMVLLVVALGWVTSHFVHLGRVEYTDDAQVQRHITPINTRVQGFIKEIRYEEFQHVNRGDTLVIIEDAEYRLQLAQAEANVVGSRFGERAATTGISTAGSNVMAVESGTEEARINMENAERDLRRYEELLRREAVTQKQYDDVKTRYEAARARHEQLSHQHRSSVLSRAEQTELLSQVTAGVSVAEAALNLARLNLSYTVITATADGYMGTLDIHEGQLVMPGQQLARIVDDADVWVLANYRETQMDNIGIGSKVEFTADAVPDVVYHGVVVAISAAAGSAYSMIPVDNATGNFVKVEQRVPVRIALTGDNKSGDVALLRAGLNVQTEVEY